MKNNIHKYKSLFYLLFFILSLNINYTVKASSTFDYSVFLPKQNNDISSYYNPEDFKGQPFPLLEDDPPCIDLNYDLKIGTRDYSIYGPVAKLQMFLYSNEYMAYPPTGLYKYYTYNGVRNFQRDNDIKETGVVDKETRIALKKATCKTSPITVLQNNNQNSYYCSLNNVRYSSQAELNSKCISQNQNNNNTNYTITYNPNGADTGSPNKTYESVIAGNSIVLPDEGTMFKNGHIFYGWSTSPSGTNPMSSGTLYIPNYSATLYAVWDKDNSSTYTVEYDPNGADSGNPSVNSQTVNIGDSISLASQGTLVKSGYIFRGWSENPSGSPLLSPNSIYTPINDINLYAVWENLNNNNNGNSGNNSQNINVIRLTMPYQGLYFYSDYPVASQVTLSYIYDACLPGGNQCETLSGISTIPKYSSTSSIITSSNPNKQEINNYSLIINNISPSSDNQYIYTCEKGSVNCNFSSTYTITYNSNNADSGSPSVLSQTVNINGSVNLATQNTLVRNGYVFDGWSASPSGTNPLSAGDSYIPSSNITLYAIWKPLTNASNKISLIISDNSGSFYISSTLPVESDIAVNYSYLYCYKTTICSTKTGTTYIYYGNMTSDTIQTNNSTINPVKFFSQKITSLTPNNDSSYSYTY